MVDPQRYYDLEAYLLNDVRQRFHSEGSIGAFDFFSIVMWKANRVKPQIASRLRRMDPKGRTCLDPIVRDLTRSLHEAGDEQARMRLLMEAWHFGLPMTTAILSILWPDEFTVYDTRVCEQLGRFGKLANVTKFDRVWAGYCEYRGAVQGAAPGQVSLRDKDRHLWASSVARQLEADIASGFPKKSRQVENLTAR